MKHTYVLALIFCGLLAASCGQTDKQKAEIRKQLEDSIRNAHFRTIDSLNKIQTQEKRDDSLISVAVQATKNDIQAENNYKSQIAKSEMLYFGLKNQLKNSIASLAVANDRMNRIKEFQFGRSVAEREQQIRGQNLTIQYILERINTLRQNVSISKVKILKMNPGFKDY